MAKTSAKLLWVKAAFAGVAILTMLLGHPYLFGLRGRVAESIFQSHIHAGMTLKQVINFERKLGGADDLPAGAETWLPGAPGVVRVKFTDSVTLCIVAGKAFDLDFNSLWLLESWTIRNWGNAC
jgi:hypothetical protein